MSSIYGKRIINFLRKQQVGESIRDLGLEGQIQKAGTPTMGGIIIIFSTLIPVLLLTKLDNIYIIILLITTVWMGLIGFLDDYKKISSIILTLFISLFILLEIGCTLFFIFWISNLNIENLQMLSLPFFKNQFIALGIFFIPFILIVIVGSANAVNLTDGLDGLAIVPVMIVALSFAIICYLAGNIIFS